MKKIVIDKEKKKSEVKMLDKWTYEILKIYKQVKYLRKLLAGPLLCPLLGGKLRAGKLRAGKLRADNPLLGPRLGGARPGGARPGGARPGGPREAVLTKKKIKVKKMSPTKKKIKVKKNVRQMYIWDSKDL